jgi:hypothetical protein
MEKEEDEEEKEEGDEEVISLMLTPGTKMQTI